MEQQPIEDDEAVIDKKSAKDQAKAKKVAEEAYIERIRKYIDEAKEAIKYSIVRFDLLIISLSTGALILSIGYTKGAVNLVQLPLIKTAWLVLVGCLVSNLISQVTGYYSNSYDVRVCENLVRKKKNKELKGNQDKYEKFCRRFKTTTLILNGISLVAFMGGLICLILFFNANI